MPIDHEATSEIPREELGRTEVCKPIAAALTLIFLSIMVLPVGFTIVGQSAFARRAETGESLSSSLGPWQDLGAGLRAGTSRWQEEGLFAANRSWLSAIEDFEENLEEDSPLHRVLRPRVQEALTSLFGAGNEQVYPGGKGWLFFRKDFDHLVGPPFLEKGALQRRAREGKAWEPAIHPDPRPAILELYRALQPRGIHLLLLPTPTKLSIHPERMVVGRTFLAPLQNPSWKELLGDLEESGIEVLDIRDLLWQLGRTEPAYLRADTHWTPRALDAVAQHLASAVRRIAGPFEEPPTAFRRRELRVASQGDTAALLGLPRESDLLTDQEVRIQVVSDGLGRLWKPDPEASVLLLGDSFTNIYSDPGLGWGQGAGLAEQLSYHLRQSVDRIAHNAGGAHASRETLARELDRPRGMTGDRLHGKRVLIYQFSTRQLSSGDWRPIRKLATNEP